MSRPAWRLVSVASLAIAAWTFTSRSDAAGGHFDVDDAVTLEAGQCQSEVWALRSPRADSSLLHFGPGCRLGAVEATVNLERSATHDETDVTAGPQLKWATALGRGGVSIGAAWSAAIELSHRDRAGQTAYVPITWRVTPSLQLHLNAGVDRAFEHGTHRREGASAEWSPRDSCTLIAERSKILDTWTSRLGGRYNLSASTSIDLSVARAGPQVARLFAIGLNQTFTR